jgi:hypothetical protein
VLDVIECLQRAADTGSRVDVATTCERPEPVSGLIDLTSPA